jgi:hypothetical protein
MSKGCERCKAHKEAIITAWAEKAQWLSPNLTPQQCRQIATEHYYAFFAGGESFLNGPYDGYANRKSH